ncbi:MAG: hypothetical protein R3A13_02835 [Bdellovibrionota bacterium]
MSATQTQVKDSRQQYDKSKRSDVALRDVRLAARFESGSSRDDIRKVTLREDTFEELAFDRQSWGEILQKAVEGEMIEQTGVNAFEIKPILLSKKSASDLTLYKFMRITMEDVFGYLMEGVRDDKTLLSLLKRAANNDPRGVASRIQKLNIDEQPGLIEVAKIIAKIDGRILANNFKNFGIQSKESSELLATACFESPIFIPVPEDLRNFGIDFASDLGGELICMYRKRFNLEPHDKPHLSWPV